MFNKDLFHLLAQIIEKCMPTIEKFISVLCAFLSLLMTIVIVVLILWLAHVFLIKRQDDLGNEKLFSRLPSMLGLTIAGILS